MKSNNTNIQVGTRILDTIVKGNIGIVRDIMNDNYLVIESITHRDRFPGTHQIGDEGVDRCSKGGYFGRYPQEVKVLTETTQVFDNNQVQSLLKKLHEDCKDFGAENIDLEKWVESSLNS